MRDHVKILGALYIVFSALGIFTAIILFIVIAGGGIISGDFEAMSITMLVATILGGLIAFFSIPGLIGGIGLFSFKSWARILVLVLGCLNLLNIPIGTALGIYTIWVLTKPETEKLFLENK